MFFDTILLGIFRLLFNFMFHNEGFFSKCLIIKIQLEYSAQNLLGKGLNHIHFHLN